MPNFIALGIYFIFETKFSWNERIDTCFNVKFVLLGRNFNFLGDYSGLLLVTWWLPVVTARFHLLLLLLTFSMNGLFCIFLYKWNLFKNSLRIKLRAESQSHWHLYYTTITRIENRTDKNSGHNKDENIGFQKKSDKMQA